MCLNSTKEGEGIDMQIQSIKRKVSEFEMPTIKFPIWLAWGVRLLMILWALSKDALTVLEYKFKVDVPVVKYVVMMFQSLDGRGVEMVLIALGLGAILYQVHNHPGQRSIPISILSTFFAISTVLGKSYHETATWDYVFHGRIQFVLACLVMCGYYLAYKNGILFVRSLLERTPAVFGAKTKNEIETQLFEERCFLLPFAIIILLGLPVMILYFPGTLHADAFTQLWQFFGVIPMNDMAPVAVTKLMGKIMSIGKIYFASDNIGLFLYNGGQFIVQTSIFAYSFCVLKRLKTPILLRWMTLLWYAVLPIFPIWGYTLTKDTGYYLCIYLFVLVLIDGIGDCENGMTGWRNCLLFAGAIGASLFRNNGKYIVFVTLLIMALVYRKYWKQYIIVFVSCLMIIFVFEEVYIPTKGYEDGPIKEALSLPIQMTARYLRDHSSELTQEELEALQGVFDGPLEDVVVSYHPELSDPVKALFASYPSKEAMDAYWSVFKKQFMKHPDTYIQAFLNHTYGYFYPNRENFHGQTCVFYLLGRTHLEMEMVNVSFVEEWEQGRRFYSEYTDIVKRTPVIGMVFSAGMHIYILLGMLTFLVARKKKRGLAVLVPSLCMILCIASPVNAYFRYVLPLIVAFPINLAWCYYVGRTE